MSFVGVKLIVLLSLTVTLVNPSLLKFHPFQSVQHESPLHTVIFFVHVNFDRTFVGICLLACHRVVEGLVDDKDIVMY